MFDYVYVTDPPDGGTCAPADARVDNVDPSPAPASVFAAEEGWPDELFAPLQESLENGGLLLDLLREEQQAIGAAEALRARWIVDFCRSRPSSNDRPDAEIGAAAAATRAARPSILATVSEWAVDEVATALSITSAKAQAWICLLYTSPSPRDKRQSRMPSSA